MSDQTGGRSDGAGEQPGGPVYGDVPRYGYQHPGSAAPPPGYPPQSPQAQPAYPPQPPHQQGYPQQGYPQGYPQPYQQGYQQQPYQQPYQQGYVQPYVPVYPYAVWGRRVGAYLIDFAPALIAQIPFYVGYVLWLIELTAQIGSGNDTVPTGGLIWMGVGSVLLLAALGWQIYNRWIVAGRTGQSMGKRVLRVRLLAEATGQPIGALNAFLRDLLHILDGIAYVGYLWPLWDAKRQTFADKLMKTVVADLPAEQQAAAS